MKFSQRIGKTPKTKLAQVESMDGDLRNSLWSLIYGFYLKTARVAPGYPLSDDFLQIWKTSSETLILRLWEDYFKQPTDTIGSWGDCKSYLRERFFAAEWYQVYDFVEFLASNGPEQDADEFRKRCNQVLERENAAYRFVGEQLAAITSEEEVISVEDAITAGEQFPGVSQHLSAALRMMSDRKSPDFRNSIKESISAVESLAKHISHSANASLGDALIELERHRRIHPAMKKAFSALYGYTNDAEGIRHALMDEAITLTKADARFMLVCCSAFVNFVIESQASR